MATIRRPFQGVVRSRRAAGSVAAFLLAVGGLLPLTAGIVQAHDLSATFACSDADPSVPVLTIAMSEFDPTFTNTISASIDGTSVLATTTFGDAYSGSFLGGDPTSAHTAVVNVVSGDDPTGSQGFTKEFDLSVGPCQDAPSSAPSTAASASPSGGVEAATSRPRPTVPATSTVDSSSPSNPTSSVGFLLILFAVVVLVVGFAPMPTKRRAVNPSIRRRR